MSSNRRLKRLLIGLAAAGAVVATVWIATRSFAPDWIRRRIEREASEALGRQVRIAGSIDLDYSLTPRATVHDVTVANAPWGSAPYLVRVGRATVSLDLASLSSRPIRLHDVSIDDAKVWLEPDERGRGNWLLDLKRSEEATHLRAAGPPVTFDRVSIRKLEIDRASSGSDPQPIFAIASLDARVEPASGMIDLDAKGRLNDTPWNLAGRLGTLDHLYDLNDVEQAVTGTLGDANVSVRGQIRDVSTLGDPRAEIAVDGPDIAAALATFGARSPVSGPFTFKAGVTPGEDGVDLDLSAELSGVRASVRGRVDALLHPRSVDGTADVSGPDATVIGSWAHLAGLPPGPFRVTGGFAWRGSGLTLRDAKVRAGGTAVSVGGTIGRLPRCVGTDLKFAGSGTDLSRLSKLTHLGLPEGPFQIRGRFLRRDDGLAVDGVDLRTEGLRVLGDGTIGEPPRVPSLDMSFDASGPSLAPLSGIARVDLPPVPFVVRGRVAHHGRDWAFDHVQGRVDDAGIDLDARLVPAPGLAGSEVRASVSGPDLATAAGLAGGRGLPAAPFDATGHIQLVANGFDVEGAKVRVGGVHGTLEGHVGDFPTLDGTAVEARVDGTTLSDLEAWGVPVRLPPDRFTAAGRVRVDGGVVSVGDVVATAGSDRARIDGTLGALSDVSTLDLAIEASGPRLGDLMRFAPSVDAGATAHVPAENYTISGRVRRRPEGIEVSAARATVGEASIELDGTIGLGARLAGTDVRIVGDAPNASSLEQIAGISFPEGAVHLEGGIAREAHGSRAERLSLAVGEHRVDVSGSIGDPPELEGTDLTIHASGPDLGGVVVPMAGLSPVPSDPFDLSARLRGNAGRLEAGPLKIRLGDSDLEGSLTADVTGRPTVRAALRSDRLDVATMLSGLGFSTSPESSESKAAKKKGRPKATGLIPDEPLSLGVLRKVDADLSLRVARVDLARLPMRDVAITATLRDGTLRVDPIEGTGPRGGRAKADVLVEPVDGAYRARIDATLDDAKLDLSAPGESPGNAPTVDLDLRVEGIGKSLHEMAASSDGRALAVVGTGVVPSAYVDRLSSGVLRSLFDAMNPARKTSPATAVECGVVGAEIDHGKAAFDPIAVRTDKMTVTGRGKIDFGTEAIDLSWTIKSRKGVGLSAGSIANPYIKLGGTLSSPSLEAKPLEAVTSTGAAVATMGLTILFRSVYERITAEKKVCVDALEKARKNEESRRQKEKATSEAKENEP